MIEVAQAELPTGYKIIPDAHQPPILIYVYKHGLALRQRQRVEGHRALPVWFRVAHRARAIEYAWKHAELGLEISQQVPDFEYYSKTQTREES